MSTFHPVNGGYEPFVAGRDLGDETTAESMPALLTCKHCGYSENFFLAHHIKPGVKQDFGHAAGLAHVFEASDKTWEPKIATREDIKEAYAEGVEAGRQLERQSNHADMTLEYYDSLFKDLGCPPCERHGDRCSVRVGNWLRPIISDNIALTAQIQRVQGADFMGGLVIGGVIVTAILSLLELLT